MNNSHQILGKSPKLTILYLRLSKGDIGQGESNSITNQRRLLTEYAERNGFTPYECVVEAAVIIEPTRKTQQNQGVSEFGSFLL